MNAIPESIRKALDGAEWLAESGWRYFSDLVDSPIERLLLEQIIASQWGADQLTGLSVLGREYSHGEDRYLAGHGVICYMQGSIGSYRADFVFDVDLPFRDRTIFVVECDGHDFHERTKEQAAHDKQRDRFMVARGVVVLRFTGSEIFRDAAYVWRQIVEIITDGRGFNWPHPSAQSLRIGDGFA